MFLILDKSEGMDSFVVAAQSMAGLLGDDAPGVSWCCQWMVLDSLEVGILYLTISSTCGPFILLLLRVWIPFSSLQVREVFLS